MVAAVAARVAAKAAQCLADANCRAAAFAAVAAAIHGAQSSASSTAGGANSPAQNDAANKPTQGQAPQAQARPAATTPAPKPPSKEECDKMLKDFYDALGNYMDTGSMDSHDKALEKLNEYSKQCKNSDPDFAQRNRDASNRFTITARLAETTKRPTTR